MLFEDILIILLKAVDGERTVSSPYHLLKGKKSGQTLQDIGYYKLYPYFGILPKLEKSDYDRAVGKLLQKGFITIDGQVVRMTAEALKIEPSPTLLNGWKYRGNEAVFMARLSLIVQTLSHVHQKSRIFDPVVISEDTQRWVKNYLKNIHYKDPAQCKAFKDEMVGSLGAVAVDEAGKMIVIQRLSGLKVGGLTWEQMSRENGLSVIDVRIQAIEVLHGWMAAVEQDDFPLLRHLLDGLIQQSALTETARRTQSYFKNGRSLEEIAALRGLKTSTIEDHFVEMAMNDSGFDILEFMEAPLFAKIIAVSESRNTKRLRDIKEKVPEASYFQLRLALAAKGELG